MNINNPCNSCNANEVCKFSDSVKKYISSMQKPTTPGISISIDCIHKSKFDVLNTYKERKRDFLYRNSISSPESHEIKSYNANTPEINSDN